MTKITTRKNQFFKWIAGILMLIFALVGAAAIFLAAKWKPFLTEKIKTGIYEASDHLYQANFKDMHLNVLTGTATLDSVTLYPDTAVFNQLRKKDLAPVHLFEIKLAELKLTRIGILTAYFKKRINMNAIILDRPSINMLRFNVNPQPDTVKTATNLYQKISKSLESVHIRSIKILNADFDYIRGENREVLNAVKKLNVSITDVLIDSVSQHDKERFYYSKDVAFELIGYKSLSKDKMYTLKIDTLKGFANTGKVGLSGFQMIPMYPDLQFSRKYKTQRDRYNLKFNQVEFRGLDLERFNRQGRLFADALSITDAKVNIFMNRELPPSTGNKGKNFPQLALQRVELPLVIDTVGLNNVDVAYTEYNPIAQERGTVNIDNLRGTIRNVTNDSLQKSKQSHMVANLKAKIIKAADLDVKLDFNLADKNGAFNFTGSVGKFNMPALNPLSSALGLVKIETGNIQQVTFNINGNTVGSTGSLKMYYNNLKVQLLKEGEDGEAPKKRGLLSFLANKLVIKDANPEKDKPLRVASVQFTRSPSQSFFSLLWKSVFDGIRETVGIGFIKPKSAEKSHEKIEAKLEERKEKRQEKREEKKEEAKKVREKQEKAAEKKAKEDKKKSAN
jgi:hypothetical protein